MHAKSLKQAHIFWRRRILDDELVVWCIVHKVRQAGREPRVLMLGLAKTILQAKVGILRNHSLVKPAMKPPSANSMFTGHTHLRIFRFGFFPAVRQVDPRARTRPTLHR